MNVSVIAVSVVGATTKPIERSSVQYITRKKHHKNYIVQYKSVYGPYLRIHCAAHTLNILTPRVASAIVDNIQWRIICAIFIIVNSIYHHFPVYHARGNDFQMITVLFISQKVCLVYGNVRDVTACKWPKDCVKNIMSRPDARQRCIAQNRPRVQTRMKAPVLSRSTSTRFQTTIIHGHRSEAFV